MKWLILVPSVVCWLTLSASKALTQSEWEFLGPGSGDVPYSLFVSENAVYVGMSEDGGGGLGLHRYQYETGNWDLFAWEGYLITGVTVWGDSDENVLVLRQGPGSHSEVLRSTDGGESWNTAEEWDFRFFGLNQSDSESSYALIHNPLLYSTDAGWSWETAEGALPWNGTYDSDYDPANAEVAYLTGVSSSGFDTIFKTSDGGANWSNALHSAIPARGIGVESAQSNHVLNGTLTPYVQVTTNAGEDWTSVAAPLRTKVLVSPSWFPTYFYVVGSDLNQLSYDAWRTGNLGETWAPCGGGLPDLPEGTNLHDASVFLKSHPTDPVLFVALEGSGVWRLDLAASSIQDLEDQGLSAIRLRSYPNPSWGPFECAVELSTSEHVVLTLHDARGRALRRIADGFYSSGRHSFDLDAFSGSDPVTSGIYYLKLDAGGVQEQKKIVLLR